MSPTIFSRISTRHTAAKRTPQVLAQPRDTLTVRVTRCYLADILLMRD